MNTHRWRDLVGLLMLAAVAAPIACEREPKSAATLASETDRDQARAMEKLADATQVLHELATSKDISAVHRRRTRCVIVVPAMVSGAFLVGGQHGDGVVTCRTPAGWSAPAFIKMSGGSAGLQAGVQSADLLMLCVSDRAVAKLFSKNFQLGADASVAAGPVGEGAKASTDVQATAEFLTYARSRGLFAGAEVSGVGVKQDFKLNAALYGPGAEARAILNGNLVAPTQTAAFLEQVRRSFPE